LEARASREYISTKSSAEPENAKMAGVDWPVEEAVSHLSRHFLVAGLQISRFEGTNPFDIFQTLPLGRECC